MISLKQVAAVTVLTIPSLCWGGSVDMVQGEINSDMGGSSTSPVGKNYPLPESSPSVASANDTLSDGHAKGEFAFDTSSSTSNLGGGIRASVSTGDPDDHSSSLSAINGNANIALSGNMYFSYFALLSPGSSFSSDAANVSVSIPAFPVNNLPQSAGHFGGAGIPLSPDLTGQDHLLFRADAIDPTDIDYGNTDSNMFVGFKYYERVANPSPGDIDGDGDIDDEDVTFQLLSNTRVDLDGNNIVNFDDVYYLVEDLLDTRLGDFNLDGAVNFDDFLILQNNFGYSGSYTDGDADGNLIVNYDDYLILQNNFGYMR